MMGGLITGMHTQHGYFDTLGVAKNDDKGNEEIEDGAKEEIEQEANAQEELDEVHCQPEEADDNKEEDEITFCGDNESVFFRQTYKLGADKSALDQD